MNCSGDRHTSATEIDAPFSGALDLGHGLHAVDGHHGVVEDFAVDDAAKRYGINGLQADGFVPPTIPADPDFAFTVVTRDASAIPDDAHAAGPAARTDI